MKYILAIIFSCSLFYVDAQLNVPKIELYVKPGLFFEQLSGDSLVPPKRRNVSRFGDVETYVIQLATPLKNQRFTLKTGIGLSQRHYSLNKYSLSDGIFFIRIPIDSFSISYVRFTNNYFQIPVSVAYTVTRPLHNFQLELGVSVRNNFLTKSHASITFDTAYFYPSSYSFDIVKDVYTRNASKFVLDVEPYAEGFFKINNKVGLMFQFSPFSFYATKLDKQLTNSTLELFSFTFGAFYSLK